VKFNTRELQENTNEVITTMSHLIQRHLGKGYDNLFTSYVLTDLASLVLSGGAHGGGMTLASPLLADERLRPCISVFGGVLLLASYSDSPVLEIAIDPDDLTVTIDSESIVPAIEFGDWANEFCDA